MLVSRPHSAVSSTDAKEQENGTGEGQQKKDSEKVREKDSAFNNKRHNLGGRLNG